MSVSKDSGFGNENILIEFRKRALRKREISEARLGKNESRLLQSDVYQEVWSDLLRTDFSRTHTRHARAFSMSQQVQNFTIEFSTRCRIRVQYVLGLEAYREMVSGPERKR